MIINKRELISFHEDKSSRLILSALDAALHSVMPNDLLERAVEFNKELSVRDIRGKKFKIRKFNRVYVVGAGKAVAGMACSLASILRGGIEEGAITVPLGMKARVRGISVTYASHPVPDRLGIEGTRKILRVLAKAKKNDLIFVLISGGGSALMPLPASGLSLGDKQRITSLLLQSGASILEMNTVRKHLSAVKGGQLLRHIDRECTVISLILSDVVGDDLTMIASGPTCPDRSTFGDALGILKKYRINDPKEALTHIVRGAKGEIKETPKPYDRMFYRVHNVLVGNNAIACKSAVHFFKKCGIQAMHLGSEFDGQAKDFGAFLANLASTLLISTKPFAVVAGGETTVRLNSSENGIGGRNQEAALAYVAQLHRHDISAAYVGTDGIDGSSNAAGALVSPKTISAAKLLDLKEYLESHDSYHALKKLHSLIFTGYTGTNVNDIAVICGPPAKNGRKMTDKQFKALVRRNARKF